MAVTSPSGVLPSQQLSAPILLRLALYRWRIRIFYFQPKRRAAPAIGRAEAFAHNALATETASLAKYSSAIFLMLVEYDAQIRV